MLFLYVTKFGDTYYVEVNNWKKLYLKLYYSFVYIFFLSSQKESSFLPTNTVWQLTFKIFKIFKKFKPIYCLDKHKNLTLLLYYLNFLRNVYNFILKTQGMVQRVTFILNHIPIQILICSCNTECYANHDLSRNATHNYWSKKRLISVSTVVCAFPKTQTIIEAYHPIFQNYMTMF